MRNPTSQEVVDSIIQGIKNAQRDYKKAAWTPICEGPEYLITINIFCSLWRLTKRANLTLEAGRGMILNYLNMKDQNKAHSSKRPPSEDNMRRRRSDILLWDVNKDIPRAIIEVKRRAEDWIKDPSDIKRVAGLLNEKKYRKLEFGILASCIHRVVSNDNRNELEGDIHDKLRDILQVIKEKLDDYGQLGVKLEPSNIKPLNLKCEDAEDSSNWVWQPVVFKIYHRRSSQ